MAYSKTKIVIGCLAYIPVLIFIANFTKGKFRTKTEVAKYNGVKEEPVKIIEIQDTVFKEGKVETINELRISWIVSNRSLMRFMKR